MNENKNYLIPASIVFSAIIIAYVWLGAAETKILEPNNQAILPNSIELPVIWGNLGARMVSAGVIDRAKLETIYAQRGARLPDGQGLTDEEKQLLEKEIGKLKITQENSGFILNMLWALGLGNKNEISVAECKTIRRR